MSVISSRRLCPALLLAATFATSARSQDETVNGNLTVSGGAITGGTNGLTVNAGGTNKNINITPSGGGNIYLNASYGGYGAHVYTHGGIRTTGGELTLGPVSGNEALRIRRVQNGSFPYWIMDFNSAGGGMGLRLGNGDTGYLSFVTNGEERARFHETSGNFSIGTTVANHKLTVNGAIRATEVIVESGWADYVFGDQYRNAPLSEVEAHIKAHRHLPGVPSAKQIAEKGVSLGEMQATLLAKVEELTLHLIAQEKRIQKLETENTALRTAR